MYRFQNSQLLISQTPIVSYTSKCTKCLSLAINLKYFFHYSVIYMEVAAIHLKEQQFLSI